MSNNVCNKNIKKRDIRNALIRAGVPVNRTANLNEDNDNYDENSKNNVYNQYISSITTCDARCQSQNRINNKLKRIYLDAKLNAKTAPEKKDNAFEKYFVSTYGKAEYNEVLNNKYEREIKQLTDDEKIKYDIKKEKILLTLENFDKNIALNSKLNELIEINLIENNELIQKIDSINSTINTNERKTYYNSQQLNNLTTWKKYTMRYLLLLYVLLFAAIIIINRTALNYKVIIKFLILLLIPLLFIPIVTRIILTFYNFITKDASNMGPAQLLTKILLETGDEMKMFFGIFYAPMEILAL